MNKTLKEVAGVEVAQKEIVVSVYRLNEKLSIEFYAYKFFKNTEAGILALLKWSTHTQHTTHYFIS